MEKSLLMVAGLSIVEQASSRKADSQQAIRTAATVLSFAAAQRDLSPKESQQKATDYYRDLQEIFDEETKGKGWGVNLDFYTQEGKRHAKSIIDNLFIGTDLSGEGRIYKETVQTAVEMVEKLLLSKHLAIIGLVQSAKTHSQILGCLLGCTIYWLKTGVYIHPTFFVPHMKGTYYGQFKTKLDQFFACFSKVKIWANDTTNFVELIEHINELRHERTKAIDDALNSLLHEFGKTEYQQMNALAISGFHTKDVLVLPMSVKYKKLLQIMFGELTKKSHRLYACRDESHSAIAEGGTNDDINDTADKRLTDESLYEMFNNGKTQFLAVSATNWPALHLEYVLLRVNENYHGFDFGFWTDDEIIQVAKYYGVEITSPEHVSMTKFANIIQCRDFSYINPAWYRDEDSFNTALMNDEHAYANWEGYKNSVNKAMLKAIIYLLVTNNTKNHRGILLRFVNKNKIMDECITQLDPVLKKHDIKIVRDYGGDHKSALELLARNKIGPQDKFVVITTAGARMSDSYPAYCGYGLDFTHETQNLGALLQGILGRLCGYYKNSFVVLSDKNNQRLNEYINNDHVGQGNLLPTVATRKRRPHCKFTVAQWGHIPLMSDIFQRLQSFVNKLPLYERKSKFDDGSIKRMYVIKGGRGIQCDFFKDVLLTDGLALCEKFAAAKILRPEEIDGQGYQYLMSEFRVFITFRMKRKGDNYKEGGGDKGEEALAGKLQRVLVRLEENQSDPSASPTVIGFELPYYKHKTTIHNTTITDCVPSKIKNPYNNGASKKVVI